jgi:hypothetical protein
VVVVAVHMRRRNFRTVTQLSSLYFSDKPCDLGCFGTLLGDGAPRLRPARPGIHGLRQFSKFEAVELATNDLLDGRHLLISKGLEFLFAALPA